MAENKRQSGNWKVIFALVAFAFVTTLLAAGGIYALMGRSDTVEEGSFLEIVLDGSFAEGPATDPLAGLGLQDSVVSLWDLRRALRAAADDDNIAGVFVTIRTPAVGFGQSQEIVSELERFREVGGKPVHALIQTDMIGDRSFYLATGADQIWVTPEAWWLLNGLHADVTFWKGTLDKLQVEADVIMYKEYKSAGEAFANYEMSEPMREALTDVLGDLQEHWIGAVASRRGLGEAVVRAIVDEGTLSGTRAVEAGLIDHTGFRDQVKDALVEAAGLEDYKRLSVSSYLSKQDDDPSDSGRIAVVFGEGAIVSSAADDNPFSGGRGISGPSLAAEIRKAAEDDAVSAIVFRVNSPGGSAVGSDLIWREIEHAQENGTPVVVSMSSVAGSGGYWVAMGADAIVAQPTTITGSIGVVFTKINLRGFYTWIGANIDSLSFAENSDLLSPYSSFTEEQRAQVVDTIGVTYANFVGKVAEGRGLSFDVVEPMAHGRIWSGQDAKDMGLIDELGGLDVAIRLAAEKADLDPDTASLVVYPEPKNFMDLVLSGDFGKTRTTAPSAAEVQSWLHEAATPRVQALMPQIEIY